jgi:hypothetical protein
MQVTTIGFDLSKLHSGRDHASWPRDSHHLGDHLFNLRENVEGERGNGRVE